MKRLAIICGVVSSVLLLGGCFSSLGSPQVPAERFYRLSASSASTAGGTSATAVSITLDPIDARGVYVERALLHRGAAAGAPLEQYPYASWAEPPDTMLQDILLTELRSAFSAMQVRAPGQRATSDIRVSMRLRALEQIREGSSARARFAASYSAFDRNNAVLFVMDWDREAPAAGPSPLEYVNALNALLTEADHALIAQLREAVAKAKPADSH